MYWKKVLLLCDSLEKNGKLLKERKKKRKNIQQKYTNKVLKKIFLWKYKGIL